jgi:serine/threonine protein kinase
LINKDGVAQLCDFGLACFMKRGLGTGLTTPTNHTGTTRYLSYELVEFMGKAVPTTASDVYALGCVAFEVGFRSISRYLNIHWFTQAIYRTLPYATLDIDWRIAHKISQGAPPAKRPEKLEGALAVLWDILGACWSTEPDDRPTARDIRHYMDQSIDELSEELATAYGV